MVYFAFHREHRIALQSSNYLYVAASVIAVLSTIVIVVKTKALDTEKDRVLTVASKANDLRVAKANENAAAANATAGLANESAGKAQQSLALAELHSAKASSKAERFRLDIAKANEKAAEAELALTKFRQPRSLSQEQQAKLVTALQPFAGQNFALAVFPDPEPLALLTLIDSMLRAAGWKRVPAQIQQENGILINTPAGPAASMSDSSVSVYVSPDDAESLQAQAAVCLALRAAGISCETHNTPQLLGKFPKAITIGVGKKP
jgi:hypothetical protein